ncbi:MAG: cysteine dioxygenase family protein [Saprospiraceae bacterium]|nr:cysteine dioxygenase family protein [Saprospiraceae bacterium]
MHQKITSLSQLINLLENSTKDEYKSIGARIEIPLEEFVPYLHWYEEHYTRNCIIRKENFELILLCWEPHQITPVHCHGGEECWVYIVNGKINESHYHMESGKLKELKTETLLEGSKSFMSDDMGYHSLNNVYPTRAISLHLYMDPIDHCSVYDKSTFEFIPRSLTYHSYEGILEETFV